MGFRITVFDTVGEWVQHSVILSASYQGFPEGCKTEENPETGQPVSK